VLSEAEALVPVREGSPRQARNEFMRGLREGHPIVLGVALSLVLAALVGLQWFFASGAFTALPEPLLLRDSNDDYTHVSYEVGLLKRHPPREPAIYVVGGSSARDCLDSAQAMAKQVSVASGLNVCAYNLSSAKQSFAESMAIVDNLPRGPAIVLVAVSANRFGISPRMAQREAQGEDLPLSSPSLKRCLDRGADRWHTPRTLLPGIMNYGLEYYRTHVASLMKHKRLFVPYTHGHAHPLSLKMKRAFVRVWLTGTRSEGLAAFRANFEYNSYLLNALLQVGEQRGFHMVLFETPENRDVVRQAYDIAKIVYQPRCVALAQAHGTQYLNFVDKVDLHNRDFRDLTHVLSGSSAKFRRYLGNEVVWLLLKWSSSADRIAGS